MTSEQPETFSDTPHRSKTWTKSEIEAFLATEQLRYQKVDLPFGLSTPGTEREQLCQIAFSGDLAGKSILDIGSYLGYFCLRGLELGAATAHGLEIDPEKIRQAYTLAEIKGLSPTYSQVDFERDQIDGQYDIILALNILHHLFDPIHALQRLARMTRHRLVLEVASLNARDGWKLKINFLTRILIAKLPIIFVARGIPESHKRTSVQKFFLTAPAIERILNDHTKLFAKFEVFPSTFKERFIVVATRRKIRHLVIVSGPTSSGKSTFIKKMINADLPESLLSELPKDIRNWPRIGANRLFRNPKETVEGLPLDVQEMDGLVLHYDIMRPFARGIQDFGRDQMLDLIDCAEKVTVINLKVQQERLCQQLIENEIVNVTWQKGLANNLLKTAGSFGDTEIGKTLIRTLEKILHLRLRVSKKSRHERLLDLYKTPGWLEHWCLRWEKYLKNHGSKVRTIPVEWPAADTTKS